MACGDDLWISTWYKLEVCRFGVFLVDTRSSAPRSGMACPGVDAGVGILCSIEAVWGVLCTSEFPCEEPKTGLNIKKEILTEMEKYDITSETLQNAVFVTDQASNMKLALSTFRRLPCVAHILATVLRHTLDEENFLRESAPRVLNLLQTCRNLTAYLKRTGLSKCLDSTVKTMVVTRWNTVVDMIESVANVIEEVAQLLLQRGEMHRLDGWNGELATNLVAFLSKFRQVIEELQSSRHPTIQFVLIRYHELLTHCSEHTSDFQVSIDLSLLSLLYFTCL